MTRRRPSDVRGDRRHGDGGTAHAVVAPPGGPDMGLFGPTSQTWRLHSEPVLGLAVLRGHLLAALHPDNPGLRDDIWARLARSSELIGVVTYGSTGQALAAGARVRIEQSLRGDDHLGAWMHCCQVDSVIEIMRRSGVSVDDVQADTYVAEQVSTATLMGLEPPDVPAHLDGIHAFLRDERPALRATIEARADVGQVVAPSVIADRVPVARPPWTAVAGLAFAALPGWARRMYAMPDLPGAAALHGSATTVALHTLRESLRGVTRGVPQLQSGPHLRSARERLAAPPDRFDDLDERELGELAELTVALQDEELDVDEPPEGPRKV